MDPASLADNKRRVREELQRMALEELRGGIFPMLRSLASERVLKKAPAGSRSVEVARRSSAFSVFRIWFEAGFEETDGE